MKPLYKSMLAVPSGILILAGIMWVMTAIDDDQDDAGRGGPVSSLEPDDSASRIETRQSTRTVEGRALSRIQPEKSPESSPEGIQAPSEIAAIDVDALTPPPLDTEALDKGAATHQKLDKNIDLDLLAERAQRIQYAIAEGRFFPPEAENALDLTVAMLAMQPDNLATQGLIDHIITSQKGQVIALLQEGQPLEALEITIQMLDAIADYGTKESNKHNDWLLSLQPKLEVWYRQLEPNFVVSLISKSNEAIDQFHLTTAPDGQKSASVYLDKLVLFLGNGHEDVISLVKKSLKAYRHLVEDLVAKSQHIDALEYVERMESFTSQFRLPTTDIAELRSIVAAGQAEQEQYLEKSEKHEELLRFADDWREKGQLIEPPGANALELLVKAIELDVKPLATMLLLEDVIMQSRQIIDPLIEAKRFNDASDQLEQLSTVLERTGIDKSFLVFQFRNEAIELKRQANVLEKKHIKEELQRLEAEKKVMEKKQKRQTNVVEPLTFINPF